MKNYSLAYPRIFAAVSALDNTLSPLEKWVLLALPAAEAGEFFRDMHRFAPRQIVALAALNVVGAVLFHLFAEKKGQAFLVALTGKFKRKVAALLR